MSGHGGGWANPGPAGLVALAMACFIFFAIQTGQVTGAAIGLMGIWLLGGFVVQVIVGVLEILEGNTTGGNVFTYFSAFFMLVTGLELIFKFFAGVNGWKIDARVDGWAWLALSSALTLWTPAYFKSPKSLLGVVLALLPALWIVTFTDMGVWPRTLVPISGWCLFIAGWLGLYTGAAVILNTAFGRTILPTGAPIVKPQPVQSSSKAA
ncbi:MAG: GPR1/FUN34/YaaH family transporter [Firmicutes bacterium]|nr:GPR1/FUN34/YaaH family transporter [Bacillota bacterium]